MIIFIDDSGAPPPAGSTWDPALKGANIVLSNGDMDATKVASGYQTVYGTQGRSSGRYAFEVLVTAKPSISTILIGIADKTNSAGVIATFLGNNSGPLQTLGYNDDNGSSTAARIFRRMTVGTSTSPISGTGNLYTAGDIITVDVNFGTNAYQFYKNGVALTGAGTGSITASTYFPGASVQSNAAVRLITTGLSYLPSGATEWG